MTMFTRTKSEPDLDALFAAVDAPEQEHAAEIASRREADHQRRKAALVPVGEAVAALFEPVKAALGDWNRVMPRMNVVEFAAELPSRVAQALDWVRGSVGKMERLCEYVPKVQAWVRELRAPLLSPARLEEIKAELNSARGAAGSWPSLHVELTRLRVEMGETTTPADAALAIVKRASVVTPEDLEARAQHQRKLDAASAAMPPIAPPAPRRGIPGADFDAAQPAPPARRPLLQNMEGL